MSEQIPFLDCHHPDDGICDCKNPPNVLEFKDIFFIAIKGSILAYVGMHHIAQTLTVIKSSHASTYYTTEQSIIIGLAVVVNILIFLTTARLARRFVLRSLFTQDLLRHGVAVISPEEPPFYRSVTGIVLMTSLVGVSGLATHLHVGDVQLDDSDQFKMILSEFAMTLSSIFVAYTGLALLYDEGAAAPTAASLLRTHSGSLGRLMCVPIGVCMRVMKKLYGDDSRKVDADRFAHELRNYLDRENLEEQSLQTATATVVDSEKAQVETSECEAARPSILKMDSVSKMMLRSRYGWAASFLSVSISLGIPLLNMIRMM